MSAAWQNHDYCVAYAGLLFSQSVKLAVQIAHQQVLLCKAVVFGRFNRRLAFC